MLRKNYSNILLDNNNIVSEPVSIYQKKITREVRPVPYDAFMEVPYIPIVAQAGRLINFNQNFEMENNNTELQTVLVPKEFEKGNYLVVEIDGDSMDDGTSRSIINKDKVLVKEINLSDFKNGFVNIKSTLFCIVYHSPDTYGMLCKQVLSIDPEAGEVVIHSWNQNYDNQVLQLENLVQVFILKKIVEKQINF